MAVQDLLNIAELRGVRGLHIAKLISDTADSISWDKPMRFAGATSVSNETEESSETKYHDNQPSIVNDAEGPSTYTIGCSNPHDKVKAYIDGRIYDEETESFAGTPLQRSYMAFGFIGMDTDNVEHLYWVYKGKLSGGSEKYDTKTNGTESNGLEYTYTSVYTQHKFKKIVNDKPLKFWKIPLSKLDEATMWDSVLTPDTYTPQILAAKGE